MKGENKIEAQILELANDKKDSWSCESSGASLAVGSFSLRCVSHSETGNFLDEDGHLVLLDGAGAVFVEFLEAGVEICLGELAGVVHL